LSDRIYTTTFTVPAGTAIASPFVQAVTLDDATLDVVDVVIPDGHVGLTGLAITWGGTQIMPYIQGTWVTGNNDEIHWAYGAEITAGGLVLRGYNTDLYAHSFLLRWHVSALGKGSPVVIESPQSAAAPAGDTFASVAALTG